MSGPSAEVDIVGQAVAIPSQIASAYYTLPWGQYRLTPLHELGHAIGRAHAVLNAGPVDATQVRLTNTLPAGAVFSSATVSQGSWTANGEHLIADLGTVASGLDAEWRLVVRAAAPGPLPGPRCRRFGRTG